MIETYRLSVDGTKYTFIMYEGDWRIHVQRYGTPWVIIEQAHNAIFALLYESIEAKDELAALKKLVEITKVLKPSADKNAYDDEDDLDDNNMHPANPNW